MNKVKIAVVLPIGSLDKFGYQYCAKHVLNLFSECFDKVIVATTTRETTFLPISKKNVELIVDENIMFDLNAENQEIFSIYKLYKAEKQCMYLAKEQGFDIAVRMSINMYMDELNSKKMRDYCNKLIISNKPYGYYAKLFQLHNIICYPNTLLPTVVNLNYLDNFIFDIDVIEYQGKRIPWKGGIYNKSNYFEVIDIFGIETRHDLEEKYNWYIKSYMKEWKNKNIDEFSFENEKIKLSNKLKKLVVNQDYKYSELNKTFELSFPDDAIIHEIDIKFSNYYFILFKSCIQRILRISGILKYFGNN